MAATDDMWLPHGWNLRERTEFARGYVPAATGTATDGRDWGCFPSRPAPISEAPGHQMNRPWLKFYPADWRADPALRSCSVGARGLWMEMLCIMHESQPHGHLLVNGISVSGQQLAMLAGTPLRDTLRLLGELAGAGVFSRTDKGIIYSRRMLRDEAKALKDKESGLDGGNPHIRRGRVPKEDRVRPFRRSDAPEKTQRIFDRTGGKCHWCSVDLVRTISPGEDLPPNFFHVDHVIAVCDGGSNDEENLVAACARCNHLRAHIPTSTPVNVGNVSDIKAHILKARS